MSEGDIDESVFTKRSNTVFIVGNETDDSLIKFMLTETPTGHAAWLSNSLKELSDFIVLENILEPGARSKSRSRSKSRLADL